LKVGLKGGFNTSIFQSPIALSEKEKGGTCQDRARREEKREKEEGEFYAPKWKRTRGGSTTGDSPLFLIYGRGGA